MDTDLVKSQVNQMGSVVFDSLQFQNELLNIHTDSLFSSYTTSREVLDQLCYDTEM